MGHRNRKKIDPFITNIDDFQSNFNRCPVCHLSKVGLTFRVILFIIFLKETKDESEKNYFNGMVD
jgi:hypothetical protein